MASPRVLDWEKQDKRADNPIIRGKFPKKQNTYKKPFIFRVNIVLSLLLMAVVAFSILSYMGVVTKERDVKKLHFVTNKINYENIELQNKIDYLKSFYAIDDKVQKIDFLTKPEKIIEVESGSGVPNIKNKRKKPDITSIPGF